MKKLLLLLPAVLLSTSALAAPVTPTIIGYNVDNALVSGTGGWEHEYTGTITNLSNTLKDYTNGSGTLADGIFNNNVVTTQLFRIADDTLITIFLDDYYKIDSVSLFGGPDTSPVPGQITEATFGFSGQDIVFSSTAFWDLNTNIQPPNDRFNFIPTSPLINQFTISNIKGDYQGYYSISEIQVSAVPEPSTYALMLGGLGLVGFMAARRRRTA